MSSGVNRSLDEADEVRQSPRGRLQVVTVGETKVSRSTMQPGWRWSEHYSIGPGHDGWVVGDEPWVGVDFSPAMASDFARR